jgi:hypothetical protein
MPMHVVARPAFIGRERTHGNDLLAKPHVVEYVKLFGKALRAQPTKRSVERQSVASVCEGTVTMVEIG